MKVSPLSDALGAKVTGIDLGRPLSNDAVTAIKRAWLEHIVLTFPDQDLTQEGQIAFASQFGQTGTRSRKKEDRPEGANYHDGIMLVSNVRDDKGNYIGSLPDGESTFTMTCVTCRNPTREPCFMQSTFRRRVATLSSLTCTERTRRYRHT
jgi:taurine dioxygenase